MPIHQLTQRLKQFNKHILPIQKSIMKIAVTSVSGPLGSAIA